MQAYFTAHLKESMERYQSHITRIEAHLKDENGSKDGPEDMSCLLEARLKGRQPIAITSREDTIELAFNAAIKKMKAVLDSAIGKMQNY